jgi:hypothetical protein
MVASLIGDLYLTEEARAHLERRYLDGTPTLFPDLTADWQVLRDRAERLANIGGLVGAMAATVDGARRRQGRSQIDLRQLLGVARDRALDEAATLVDAARAATLDALGDTVGAAKITERHGRTGTSEPNVSASRARQRAR